MITCSFLLMAISAHADYTSIDFYLYNNNYGKAMVMNIEGVENTDFNTSEAAGPGECAFAFDYPTAWFLSATTYRYLITIYCPDYSGSTMEKAAEIELTTQNIYLLWAAWLQFYVSQNTSYSDDVEVEVSCSAIFGADNGDITIYAK